jgi:hypothetical protein
MTEELAVWLVRLALVAAAVGVVVLAWDSVFEPVVTFVVGAAILMFLLGMLRSIVRP